MLANILSRSQPFNTVIMSAVLLAWIVLIYLGFNQNFLAISFGEVVVLLLFFLFNFAINSFTVQKFNLSKITDYTYWVWLMLLGIFNSVWVVNRITLSNTVLILLFYIVFSFRKKENKDTKLFHAGLVSGISFLLFNLNIIYLLWVYVGYFVYYKIIDKKLFIPLIGFLTPVFLTYTYFALTDQINIFRNITEMSFNPGFASSVSSGFYYNSLALLLVLLVLIIRFASIDTFSQLEVESNYKLIIALVIIGFLVMILDHFQAKYSIINLLFPASILIGNSISVIKKNILHEIIFYTLTVYAFVSFLNL